MARKAYVCTVQLLIENCDNPTEASDAVSAALTENLQQTGALLDWSYLRVGGQLLYPTETIIADEYSEGDFVE